MPIVINKESGLAENAELNPELHNIPLVDPQGQHVTADYAEMPDLLQQGYTQPNSEQLQQLMDYSKFSSPEQQLKTGLEGAAESATMGISTGIEMLAGAKGQDINKRREVNPGTHMIGQAAGLVGSSMLGVGEGALLEAAGQAGAKAVAPMLGTSFAGRVGTQATRAAIDNMLFQSGDEASKMFANDPHQSMETAVSDIGLSGLLGAGLGGTFGATSELWKMGPGKKLEGLLNAVKHRSSGVPEELKHTSQLNIEPEISAALGDNPDAVKAFQVLQESNSIAGNKAQQALELFRKDANDNLVIALGRTPEEAASISEYEVGKVAKDAMVKQLDATVKPISEQYDKFEEQFKNAIINPNERAQASNAIGQMISDRGLLKGASEAELNLANRTLEKLNSQATASDLKNYITGLRNTASWGSETYQTGKELRNILKDLQDSTIKGHVDINAPELVGQFNATQSAYSALRKDLDVLNDRLHVGRFQGPGSFIQNLKEMTPEDFLRRVSPKGDVEMQKIVSEQYPELQSVLKQNELDKVLKKAVGKDGYEVDAKKLFAGIDKLSPEMKSFILDAPTATKLDAIKQLLERIPKRMNPSGTARTLDALWKEMPASATGLGAMLMGHSGIAGYILGKVASTIGREAPDAARLAMLKFLGSAEKTSAEGFKSAVHTASAIIKGEAKLNKAASNVFRIGKDVVAEPSTKERDVLKTQIDKVAADPSLLMHIAPNVGHYIPEHGVAVGTIAARNLEYLYKLRPQTEPMSPLDPPRVASKTEEAVYDRALNIAQNPLIVLKEVRDGSVTPEDIRHLSAMYPALYKRMQEKLMAGMIDELKSEQLIPYKTKLGLSAFLGQPLDSSMAPQSIASNQISMQIQQEQNAPEAKLASLKNSPRTMGTNQQSRESDKATSRQ